MSTARLSRSLLTARIRQGRAAEAAAEELADGDKGDVVVSGTGTVLTVESATPTDGSFDVTGSLSTTGNATVGDLSQDETLLTVRSNGTMSAAIEFDANSFQRIGGGTTGLFLVGGVGNSAGADVRISGHTITLQTNAPGSGTRLTSTATALTSALPVFVPDEVYGAGWESDLSVPTKNAVYDKIETLAAGGGGAGADIVADRTALAALAAVDGDAAYLAEDGREGHFTFYSVASFNARFGSTPTLVAAVAADTLQGVYIAPASASTGASGAWVRDSDWLNPRMFGGATNYQTGNRSTGSPPYGESATSGSTDGILVDSRAACQALIATVKLHTNRELVADFSGGLWGITSTDGTANTDGLTIDLLMEYPRRFIGGEFRGIGPGRNLFWVRAGFSRFEGIWSLRSGADSGSSYGWAIRQWENGIWLRNSAQCRWEQVRGSGFRRWVVDFDPEYNLSDYNNNIGARFERLYGNNNGSACDRPGYVFQIGFTASARTGSSNSVNQRTDLTLAAGHEVIQVNDIVRDPAGNYHVVAEKVGAVVSLYPWILSTAATGTLTSCHGGVIRTGGKDVAGAGADSLSGITNGSTLDISNSLHGTEWGQVILEGGGLGMVCGTHNGINLGHSVAHMHSEGNSLDLLSIASVNVELLIGACSAWAAQDYADVFKLTRVLAANDGSTLTTSAGLGQVGIFLGGQWWQSGQTLGGSGTETKSRAYAPTLANGYRIRKVQAAGGPTNVSLKYYESVDRCLRDSFVASLQVTGYGGGAPAEAITVTLDAADVTAGITFLNGTTASTYVVGAGTATAPVNVEFWLDAAVNKWVVIDRAAASVGGGGVAAVDVFGFTFNATVTEPPASAGLRLNNASASAATKIWAHHLTRSGFDCALFLAAIAVDDDIVIQRESDATQYQRFNVTGAVVDKGAYSEIPVAFVSGGTALAGGTQVALAIVQPPATGGGGLTDGDKGDVVVGGSGSTLTVESATPAGGTFAVAGAATVSGTLGVTGTATLTAATLSGALTVNGLTALNSTVSIPAPLSNVASTDVIRTLTIGTTASGYNGGKIQFTGAGGANVAAIEGVYSLANNERLTFTVAATLVATMLANGLTFHQDVSVAADDLTVGSGGGTEHRLNFAATGGGYWYGTATLTGFFKSAGAHLYLNHSTGVLTNAGDIIVPDEAYGAGWDGDLSVPTKNALYDKIQTLGGGSTAAKLAAFLPRHNEPPTANYATLDTRNAQPVLNFDAATDESAIFRDFMATNYAGAGVTVRLAWAALTAVAGTCRWEVAFERQADVDTQADDLDVDSFATAQSAGTAAPTGSAGQI